MKPEDVKELEWEDPDVEELDVAETMGGLPGGTLEASLDEDPGEYFTYFSKS